MEYVYECNCIGISKEQWNKLMKGSRKACRKTVVKAAFEVGLIDELDYKREIKNSYYNPYNHFRTKTHLIYVHSSIEHFIRFT